MFTISAIYSIDNQIYLCTINITVFGCDFPSQIAILKEKMNYESNCEKCEKSNNEGEAVFAYITGEKTISYTPCFSIPIFLAEIKDLQCALFRTNYVFWY